MYLPQTAPAKVAPKAETAMESYDAHGKFRTFYRGFKWAYGREEVERRLNDLKDADYLAIVNIPNHTWSIKCNTNESKNVPYYKSTTVVSLKSKCYKFNEEILIDQFASPEQIVSAKKAIIHKFILQSKFSKYSFNMYSGKWEHIFNSMQNQACDFMTEIVKQTGKNDDNVADNRRFVSVETLKRWLHETAPYMDYGSVLRTIESKEL